MSIVTASAPISFSLFSGAPNSLLSNVLLTTSTRVACTVSTGPTVSGDALCPRIRIELTDLNASATVNVLADQSTVTGSLSNTTGDVAWSYFQNCLIRCLDWIRENHGLQPLIPTLNAGLVMEISCYTPKAGYSVLGECENHLTLMENSSRPGPAVLVHGFYIAAAASMTASVLCQLLDKELDDDFLMSVYDVAQSSQLGRCDLALGACIYGNHVFYGSTPLINHISGQTVSGGGIIHPFKYLPRTRFLVAEIIGSTGICTLEEDVRQEDIRTATGQIANTTLSCLRSSFVTSVANLYNVSHRYPAAYKVAHEFISSVETYQWAVTETLSPEETYIVRAFDDIRRLSAAIWRSTWSATESDKGLTVLDSLLGTRGVFGGGMLKGAIWIMVSDTDTASSTLSPVLVVENKLRACTALKLKPTLSLGDFYSSPGVRLDNVEVVAR